MATVIQFKRSSTQNDVPSTSDLALGELAVNTYHGRFYTEKNDGSASVVEVGSNPASLTINDAITFPTSDGSNGQALVTNGSGTLSFSTVGGTGLTIFTYSITSNTTSITGNDDSNNSLTYEAGKEQVFLNGVKLVDGGTDYGRIDPNGIYNVCDYAQETWYIDNKYPINIRASWRQGYDDQSIKIYTEDSIYQWNFGLCPADAYGSMIEVGLAEPYDVHRQLDFWIHKQLEKFHEG